MVVRDVDTGIHGVVGRCNPLYLNASLGGRRDLLADILVDIEGDDVIGPKGWCNCKAYPDIPVLDIVGSGVRGALKADIGSCEGDVLPNEDRRGIAVLGDDLGVHDNGRAAIDLYGINKASKRNKRFWNNIYW